MYNQKGFTLVELLIVIAIVAILAAVAVPNFRETSARNRMVANTNEFLSSIQYARSEALRRGGRIVLSPSSGSDWTNGLVVFFDQDDDGAYDSGEELRFWDSMATGTTLVAAAGSTAISFDSRGFAEKNGSGTSPTDAEEGFKLCDNRDGETGRNIFILISGSAWAENATDC